MDALLFLEELGVSYERFDQPPVDTCAESTALLPDDLPGVRTKHLFLRDRKKKNYYLVVVDEKKQVDLKELAVRLNENRLQMASEEDLEKYLQVEVGAVSMLSLINDPEGFVQFIVDQDIWNEEAFDCHPNKKGTVLLIKKTDWLHIFKKINRAPEIVSIPGMEN